MTQAPPSRGAELARWIDRARRRLWGGRPLPVWYHPLYRFPIHDLRETTGIEPRRADFALWSLIGAHNRHRIDVHEPTRAPYELMSRVHTPAYLESLTRPRTLSAVFGLDRDRFPVDAVLDTLRLAVGGTLEAARHALDHGGPTLNLLGGFHHAMPDRGHGFCAINDIAIAISVLRSKGFKGRVVVIDLDAHPPDGTAACLAADPSAWIGSISGSDWGPLPTVDETCIPGADDTQYLAALDALLARAPKPDLTFVIAGGDVMRGDRLGLLSLTANGVGDRDQRVATWLRGSPSVWLPGGGYQDDAWRLLASTACVLIGPGARPVPAALDPVQVRFEWVSRGLNPEALTGRDEDAFITPDEMDAMFGGDHGPPRLLGYYNTQGIEVALESYGILGHLRRLGYDRFEIDLDHSEAGDRARLTGEAQGRRHLLWELVLAFERLESENVLALQWMTLRHPIAAFPPDRMPLPGQDVPGLGMGEEALHLVLRIAERLDLAGVLYRPAWLHTAAFARRSFRFVDPAEQGRFDALMRDIGGMGLLEASRAVAAGRVRQDGAPWAWPAAAMILWRSPHPETEHEEALRHATMTETHFTVDPEATPAPVAPPLTVPRPI